MQNKSERNLLDIANPMLYIFNYLPEYRSSQSIVLSIYSQDTLLN